MNFSTMDGQERPAPWHEAGYWESLLANVDEMDGTVVPKTTGQTTPDTGATPPLDEEDGLEAEPHCSIPRRVTGVGPKWARKRPGF
ncbi:MAG: hypothetical protein HZY76_10895 [Anaerolineae bacterium]|nr:MAG: hypothetical protein HZY76_10895 [Anaerolineae bacterium]